MAISVVIPAYKEEKNIQRTIARVRDYIQKRGGGEVLVVVDGSPDRTEELSRRAEARVISYFPNRGKGYAVRRGLAEAVGEAILFMDADSSTDIAELDRLLPYLEIGCDVVVGSRFLDPETIKRKQTPWRRLLGRAGRLLCMTLLRLPVVDTQCGFKLFTRRAAKILVPRMTIDRWGFDMELLTIARIHGLRIQEVPVLWYDSQHSAVNPLRDAIATLVELLTIFIHRLRGHYR
ncbi:MAG: glycosyltransferase family 2 protein [Deltaproteobacteria bacterium]|nr:glycosyltransferase family 2 protein [Deltaproteobacteria bacterium]